VLLLVLLTGAKAQQAMQQAVAALFNVTADAVLLAPQPAR
jgi:hypothetical protein